MVIWGIQTVVFCEDVVVSVLRRETWRNSVFTAHIESFNEFFVVLSLLRRWWDAGYKTRGSFHIGNSVVVVGYVCLFIYYHSVRSDERLVLLAIWSGLGGFLFRCSAIYCLNNRCRCFRLSLMFWCVVINFFLTWSKFLLLFVLVKIAPQWGFFAFVSAAFYFLSICRPNW